MSAESIAICGMCQTVMESHDEVISHVCSLVKQEKLDAVSQAIPVDENVNNKAQINYFHDND